ncbi:BamA/TamA family outer membrane protein [uncultured Sphingomonas sp.]|uniref:autotransporter assembly complex protein TamA n=1 Tax=uncultured Sphingomonas sp. TaxID=158754 RepID=UPI0035CA5CE0
MGLASRRHRWFAVALTAAAPAGAQLNQPGTAPAQGPDTPRAEVERAAPQADDAPIVPEAEFDAALPPLSDDLNAPLESMRDAAPAPLPQADTTATGPAVGEAIAPVGPEDPQLARPLEPLGSFNSTPLQSAVDVADADTLEIRYDTQIVGLDTLQLTDEWRALSALRDGDGKAGNALQVAERAREDERLAIRLMKSLGYYDATASSAIEQDPARTKGPGRLRAVVTATPGRLYTLASVEVRADPTTPPDLVRRELPLRVGDPIEAARIQGAEANVRLTLPQQGYPFVEIGERDILLEDAAPTGAYTLPVATGPRSSFGRITTTGDPVFGLDHLNVFPRFKMGELYDARRVDDLRDALVATSLFGTVAVEPQRTGRAGPDGTEEVDLLVRQSKGPPRTLAGEAGFSTGQGARVEASYTHRNLFKPEGALIASVVAGTQEQGVAATFRRSNAGRRDRTVSFTASANHSSYDAFEAFTGTLSGRISYDSTPIWQKPLTYAYGFELVGTNEQTYDFDFEYFLGRGARRRRTYFIAALPGVVQFDRSDSLLNPTRGFRLTLNVSPETSVQGGVSPYVRTMAEGTYYQPVSDRLVIAGRARTGSILGIDRDEIAPSRRYYGGGGGSVRGYGFQRLGPFDPNGDPVGGRSLTEFALEARYRFGDYGIVPFIDAGNSYESILPSASSLRFGAGIGGRFYTNFGPLRVDVATPLNPRPGDGKIALYISIGQAF